MKEVKQKRADLADGWRHTREQQKRERKEVTHGREKG
jgi:hypothetical protein